MPRKSTAKPAPETEQVAPKQAAPKAPKAPIHRRNVKRKVSPSGPERNVGMEIEYPEGMIRRDFV